MRLSGLASFCTSLLLAAAALAGEVAPDPARVATLELEAALAKKRDVYLVLDPARRVLEIKSRGVLLDEIAIDGVEIVRRQPLIGGAEASPVHVPAVWTVLAGPGDTDREVVAPESLRPMPTDDEEDEEPATGPQPTATPLADPSTSYRAQLSTGWQLWICNRLPPQGRLGRFAAAVADGWARLRGVSPEEPPSVAVAVAPEDAKRVRHLMRGGMAILIAVGER